MNTKKLFMLLAAVLLGSVSAFAQSGNNEPLKGDVNGDGVVDVADIAAVIAIIKDNAAPQTTYYSYVGTDKSEKLVVAATGALKNDIATQIKSISGVKTYTSIPTSLQSGIEIPVTNDYVYVIAPTSTLNNASVYLTNPSGGTIVTEVLGTFTIDSTEYTVRCTPSEVSNVMTAWKN